VINNDTGEIKNAYILVKVQKIPTKKKVAKKKIKKKKVVAKAKKILLQ